MIVLFDVGGTNTRVAFVQDGELRVELKAETRSDSHPVEFLRGLISEHPDFDLVSSAVIALPGEIDGTTLIDANNLPSWNGADFEDVIEGDVKVVNDADAAALGEAHFGAGKALQRVGYVTVSTGIGGGLVEDGQLAGGQLGFEVGEQVLDWRTLRSFEQIAGGVAVENRLGMMTGQITQQSELDTITQQLASGLFNTALLWSTSTLIVNGPSFFESDTLWGNLLSRFDDVVENSNLKQDIELKLAERGDDAGLYGCWHLARHNS